MWEFGGAYEVFGEDLKRHNGGLVKGDQIDDSERGVLRVDDLENKLMQFNKFSSMLIEGFEKKRFLLR